VCDPWAGGLSVELHTAAAAQQQQLQLLSSAVYAGQVGRRLVGSAGYCSLGTAAAAAAAAVTAAVTALAAQFGFGI
jgi:hypothetical protein